MTWFWEYDPDRRHVAEGLPAHVVAEVEQIARQLVELAEVGVDVTDLGRGPDHGGSGGLRRFDLPGGGWMLVLPLPRFERIEVVKVIPPLHHL
ncbi:hypothetical protein GCM10009801_73160 [Streptomyces albiaxialis]|uniref:Type II toxin-antitoxin system RelE/ParE family toxin n=1 Tax=Streptomyces albiaxialis TaxID=329523 RepID=A0ABN2WWN0_9ACTN